MGFRGSRVQIPASRLDLRAFRRFALVVLLGGNGFFRRVRKSRSYSLARSRSTRGIGTLHGFESSQTDGERGRESEGGGDVSGTESDIPPFWPPHSRSLEPQVQVPRSKPLQHFPCGVDVAGVVRYLACAVACASPWGKDVILMRFDTRILGVWQRSPVGIVPTRLNLVAHDLLLDQRIEFAASREVGHLS